MQSCPLDSSLSAPLNAQADLKSDSNLGLGDTISLTESGNPAELTYAYQEYLEEPTHGDDIALEYSPDLVDNTLIPEKQSSCGSANTSPVGKMRRRDDFCVDEETKKNTASTSKDNQENICPYGLHPFCCTGTRYLLTSPTIFGYKVAYCAPRRSLGAFDILRG